MNLFRPALGPIVGHTTDSSCRLWIAAYDTQDENDTSANIRSIGVLGVVGSDNKVAKENIYYFRLHRKYHRTGTFNLGKDITLWATEEEKLQLKSFSLKPDTTYQVRMAYLEVSLNTEEEEEDDSDTSEQVVQYLPPVSVWADQLNRDDIGPVYVVADFKTQPKSGNKRVPLNFIFGSCRNNWFNGLPFKKKDSDKIFKYIYQDHASANFILMVGDQIYADSLWKAAVFKADTYKEFDEAYHEAYRTPHFRALTSHIPVYMILDDHEIEDNWTQDNIDSPQTLANYLGFKSNSRYLFNCAISAYRSYQWVHGPHFEDSYINKTRDDLIGKDRFLAQSKAQNLFYDFNCCGYPFFVLDTRTSRFKNSAASPAEDDRNIFNNHLLGRPSLSAAEPNQLDRLCTWLIHMQKDYGNRPKFIVSSGVFVPNGVDTAGTTTYAMRQKDKSDSWSAFPQTRNEVLKTIIKNKIKNVIFLSGDIHCTNIANLEIVDTSGSTIQACSVTSSPFYWPYDIIDGNTFDYIHDSQDPRTKDEFTVYETLTSNPPAGSELGTMNYTSWAYTQQNNFASVNIDPLNATLVIQFFNEEGKPFILEKRSKDVNTKPEIIQLEKW